MAILNAVFTDDYCEFITKAHGGLSGIDFTTWNPQVTHFKYGEGGWIDTGGGPVRRTPVTTLRDENTGLQTIDAIADASRVTNIRYTASTRASFSKNLISSDFSFIAPYTIEINCTLLSGEFNNDGFGNSPELWEIGLFCDHPTDSPFMMAYATFEMQTKTSFAPLTNKIRLKYKNK